MVISQFATLNNQRVIVFFQQAMELITESQHGGGRTYAELQLEISHCWVRGDMIHQFNKQWDVPKKFIALT